MPYTKEIENLKGKIKSIAESTFDSFEKSGEIQKGNLYNKFIYKFDYAGNKIEEWYFSAHLLLENKETYLYDEKGNKIEVREFDSVGNKYSKYYHPKYDDNEKLTEEFEYSEDSLPNGKSTFKYNDKGIQIEKNNYSISGKLLKKYIYNENGKLIEESNHSGGLFLKLTYNYDDNGNNNEVNWFRGKGIIFSKHIYKYEFDTKGNWIKQFCAMDNKPSTIRERIIEYY